MVLFVDSTRSIKDIIQKIGRAVRIYRNPDGSPKKDQPNGSIVVFVYVDEDLYKDCVTKDDCDKVIRESMHNNGDFSTIFNVMVALKQSDPEMFNRCICYPNIPCEKERNDKEDKAKDEEKNKEKLYEECEKENKENEYIENKNTDMNEVCE